MNDKKFLEWAKTEYGEYIIDVINCDHDLSYEGCLKCNGHESVLIGVETANKAWNACKEAYGIEDHERSKKMWDDYGVEEE